MSKSSTLALWWAMLAVLCGEQAERIRLILVFRLCAKDPKYLLNEVTAFSPDQQDEFGFNMFEEGKDWYWQSQLVDDVMDHNAILILKARQLGATWVLAAICLWYMLFKPGSYCLLFSYNEEEAKEIIARVWTMYQSLPDYLKHHVTLVSPERAEEPAEWIRVRHQGKGRRLSRIRALPATKKHGRSANATFIVMDEAAWAEYCRQIYTSANPAIARGGKIAVCSTANGVGNPETEEGNFFYVLYATKEARKLYFIFLPWNLHPERDATWYEEVAMRLPEAVRNQEYPLNEHDAFILSGALYFDRESLQYYNGRVVQPDIICQWYPTGVSSALLRKTDSGMVHVFEQPRERGQYVIASDTATGHGKDYSSAHVMDLETGQSVCEMHGRVDAPRWAEQLHYLGMWYNTALICVEVGGGYGDAVIIALRDGASGRPPYKRLYRHKSETKRGKPKAERYGLPMSENIRNEVLQELQNTLMDRAMQWVSADTLTELQGFVYSDTKPSPRAQEGLNDDRVFSLAIGCKMVRMYGNKPEISVRKKRRKQNVYRPPGVKAGAMT